MLREVWVKRGSTVLRSVNLSFYFPLINPISIYHHFQTLFCSVLCRSLDYPNLSMSNFSLVTVVKPWDDADGS